jgi:hypothetical protein
MAMKAALVVTWSAPLPGREKKALEYLREVNDFYGKLATEGKCTEPEWFMSAHGRRIWFVKGEYESLMDLMALPKVQEFIFTGDFLIRDFEYGITPIGSDELIRSFEEVGVKLGYI